MNRIDEIRDRLPGGDEAWTRQHRADFTAHAAADISYLLSELDAANTKIAKQEHAIGRLEAWAKLWKRVAKLRRMWDMYNFRRARALRIECQQLVQLLTEVYADLDKHSALLPTRFGITQRLEELGLTWDDAEEVKGD